MYVHVLKHYDNYCAIYVHVHVAVILRLIFYTFIIQPLAAHACVVRH